MNSVDFFVSKCQTSGITETKFGICDDPDDSVKTPAYVTTDNSIPWGATVLNHSGKALNFTAVDNCVEIIGDNGAMSSRCDAMLTNDCNLIFIELKDERKKWLPHAIEQLQATIDSFAANNDISRYQVKRAFACNKRHPYFSVSNKELKLRFSQQNHFRLFDQDTITVE